MYIVEAQRGLNTVNEVLYAYNKYLQDRPQPELADIYRHRLVIAHGENKEISPC